MPRRVALLADTHGFLDPRVAALVRGCDACAHAGDVGNAAVLDALAPSGGVVVAVRGNNDVPRKWPPDEQRVLADLPWEATLDLPGGRLVVVHGHRWPARDRHQRLRHAFPEARAIIYGHSHRLACDTSMVPWVLNPGAAGRVRTYGGPSCIVLDASEEGWNVEVMRLPPASRKRRSLNNRG